MAQWEVIDGCKGCQVDAATGKVRMIVTLTRAWIDGGKTKNYEQQASAKWPGIGKLQLRDERATFLKKKAAELDKLKPGNEPVVVAPVAPVSAVPTLRAAIPAFLMKLFGIVYPAPEGVKIPPRARDLAGLLAHWCEATDIPGAPRLGDRPYNEIPTEAIKPILRAWKSAHVKAWSIYHRRAALSQFFITMNGADGRNPVRGTECTKPKSRDKRGFDYDIVEQIFAQMPDYLWTKKPCAEYPQGLNGPINKSKIILRIECTTGLIPSQINRIEPSHLDFKAEPATLYTWRTKGAGTESFTLELIPDGKTALQAFAKHNLFGKIRARAAARCWNTAVEKANALAIEKTGEPLKVPKNVRPYDLRHCYGTLVYRLTDGDKAATGRALGHVPGSTATDIYVQSAVDEVQKKAMKKVHAARLFKKPVSAAV
jgi:integrase